MKVFRLITSTGDVFYYKDWGKAYDHAFDDLQRWARHNECPTIDGLSEVQNRLEIRTITSGLKVSQIYRIEIRE